MDSFNLNRVFISMFIFLGTFSILLLFLPGSFLVNQTGYSGASAQNKEVIEYFDAHGLTVYNHTLALDNDTNPFLEFGDSQSFDFGLPEGQDLEFWWDYEDFGGVLIPLFELRHTNPGPFGWWTEHHKLAVIEPYKTIVGDYWNWGLTKDALEDLWDDSLNASYCEFACDHLRVNIAIFPYNITKTISESWDDGYLGVFTSYDVDWDAMKPSAWALMASLLFFDAPTLGIQGTGGSILSYIIGLLLWSSIAILTFAIITSLVPFIRGWIGG